MDKFELISAAYKGRLLARTDAEYRLALGASYETVRDNRGSEREMGMYFGELARWVDLSASGLENAINAYVEASRLYQELDWGGRRQMASRRRFCRMLFRLYATAGRPLTTDEDFKFKLRDDDERLLAVFFPDGAGEAPAADIAMVVLLAYGILRPWAEGQRGHDITDLETVETLKALQALIVELRDDMPRLGSTEKPLAFDEWLSEIRRAIENGELRIENGGSNPLDEWTPLRMYLALTDMARACRSLVIAEQRRLESEQYIGVHLAGIWVDDGRDGGDRFWIFPFNSPLAFCYESVDKNRIKWTVSPYELRIRVDDDPDVLADFLLVSPAGNLQYAFTPNQPVVPDGLAKGVIDFIVDEASGEIARMELRNDRDLFPEWLDWRAWTRLDRSDERYARFRQALHDIYNPANPLSGQLTNAAPELTDAYNTLIGRDGRYIYVYDWQPGRCAMVEDGDDEYVYTLAPGVEAPSDALFELEVSEEHPLYAIPVALKPRSDDWELCRLAEILQDAENIRHAYIMHSTRSPLPRLLLPTYGGVATLDMATLAPLGVKKITRF